MKNQKGIFVKKKNNSFYLGVINEDVDTVEEVMDKYGLCSEDYFFLPWDEVDFEDIYDLQDYHRVYEDGRVEDLRSVVGYRIRLSKKMKGDSEDVTVDSKMVRVKNKSSKDSVAQQLGMTVERVEPVLRLLPETKARLNKNEDKQEGNQDFVEELSFWDKIIGWFENVEKYFTDEQR